MGLFNEQTDIFNHYDIFTVLGDMAHGFGHGNFRDYRSFGR